MKSGRSAGSARRAGNCWNDRSPGAETCRPQPYEFCRMAESAASASIITSRSPPIITACPIASPLRSRRALHRAHRRVFLKGERIAVHHRTSGNHKHTTVCRAHAVQPSALRQLDHRRASVPMRAGSDRRRRHCAKSSLRTRSHPEQGFRACLGIVRLRGPPAPSGSEAAAEHAIEIGTRTYG